MFIYGQRRHCDLDKDQLCGPQHLNMGEVIMKPCASCLLLVTHNELYANCLYRANRLVNWDEW